MKQRYRHFLPVVVSIIGIALVGLATLPVLHAIGATSYRWATAVGGSVILIALTLLAVRRPAAWQHPTFIAIFLGLLFLVISDWWILLR
jgi:hypothetical protein